MTFINLTDYTEPSESGSSTTSLSWSFTAQDDIVPSRVGWEDHSAANVTVKIEINSTEVLNETFSNNSASSTLVDLEQSMYSSLPTNGDTVTITLEGSEIYQSNSESLSDSYVDFTSQTVPGEWTNTGGGWTYLTVAEYSEGPYNWLDTFEDNDISEYNQSSGSWGVVQSPVLEGTYALEGQSSNIGNTYIGTRNTLYSRGDILRSHVRTDSLASTGRAGILFAVQDDTATEVDDDWYSISLDYSSGDLEIAKDSAGNFNVLNSTAYSFSAGEWLTVEVEWFTVETITARLINPDTGEQLAEVSTTDTQFSSGGYGFFDRDDAQASQFDGGDYTGSSDIDGVYVADGEDLVKYSDGGTEAWREQVDTFTNPVTDISGSSNGYVAAGHDAGAFAVFDSNGNLEFRDTNRETNDVYVAMSDDDHLYYAHGGQHAGKYNLDGSNDWNTINSGINSVNDVIIHSDGNFYIAGDNEIQKIFSNGSFSSDYSATGNIKSIDSLDNGNIVAVTNGNGTDEAIVLNTSLNEQFSVTIDGAEDVRAYTDGTFIHTADDSSGNPLQAVEKRSETDGSLVSGFTTIEEDTEINGLFFTSEGYIGVGSTETRIYNNDGDTLLDAPYGNYSNATVAHEDGHLGPFGDSWGAQTFTRDLTETITISDTVNLNIPSTTWFDSDWTYRKQFTVDGSTDGSANGYVIPLVVNYGSGTDSGRDVYLNSNCETDFSDIRFTTSDETTELDYFKEEYTSSDKAIFWVRLDSVPADPSSKDFYIYYGNSTANDTSSGVDTFEEFEGGEDSSFVFDSGSTDIVQDTGTSKTGSGSFDRSSGSDGSHTVSWKSGTSYDIDTHYFEAQLLWRGSDAGNDGLTGGMHLNDGVGDTDGYQMYFEARSGQGGSPGIRKNADFNTAQTGSYTGFSSNTWYFFRGYRDESNNVVIEHHDDTYSEDTSPLGSAQLTSDTDYDVVNFGFYSFTGSNMAADNMRIRKKLAPEPTISAWGSENTESSALTIDLTDTVIVTDTYTAEGTLVRNYSDTVVVTDSARKTIQKVLNERFNITDVVNRQIIVDSVDLIRDSNGAIITTGNGVLDST